MIRFAKSPSLKSEGNAKMKSFLAVLTVGALSCSVPMSANASDNPIFGKTKILKMDNTSMKKVVGQNTTSAYYAYLGNYYGSAAVQYGSYGAYLEAFGNTYQSTRNSYYAYAYVYSYAATAAYLNAYNYN